MAEGTKVFPRGIRVFKKHEKAPDFVIATLFISKKEMIEWLNGDANAYMKPYKEDEQIKLQMTTDRNGNPMLSVDTYGFNNEQSSQPAEASNSSYNDNNGSSAPDESDLPF
jgi:hypothetical protein